MDLVFNFIRTGRGKLPLRRPPTGQGHGGPKRRREPFHPVSPWRIYHKKWQRRDHEESDDRKAAPGTWSGYAWEGVESNHIPWSALKSAWRRTPGPLCLNCDQPTILANFGNPWTGMLNRSLRFLHICGKCRRLFDDYRPADVDQWLLANLDAETLPDFIMMWDQRKKWVAPDTTKLSIHI